MGTFAHFKSDPHGEFVKIGTCELLYYLREDKRHRLVETDFLDHFFRIPFIDEDNIATGNYKVYNRGLDLFQYTNLELAGDQGLIQLTHKSGLIINTACYHGEKLPANEKDFKCFWNGKTSTNYQLRHLKLVKEPNVIKPTIGCVHCNLLWTVDWSSIWKFIPRLYQQRFTQYLTEADYVSI